VLCSSIAPATLLEAVCAYLSNLTSPAKLNHQSLRSLSSTTSITRMNVDHQSTLPQGLAGVLNKPEEQRDSAYYSNMDASSKREHSWPTYYSGNLLSSN